jgi:hypothetical protein
MYLKLVSKFFAGFEPVMSACKAFLLCFLCAPVKDDSPKSLDFFRWGMKSAFYDWSRAQGCQMPYFQTKNPKLVHFEGLGMEDVFYMAIWFILRLIVIFYGYLVHFIVRYLVYFFPF